LQDGTFTGLDIGLTGDKSIIDGETTLPANYAQTHRNIEKAIRITRFGTASDVNVVQMDVSANAKVSLLSGAAATAERTLAPLLEDTNGATYQPVGYIYTDETKIVIRYRPGSPITALSQTPALSKSRPAQKLTLIYRVSLGAKVKQFSLGKTVIAEYDPPFVCDVQQTK